MPARQAAPCFRCREMIDINEAAFVADTRLRVVGLDDDFRTSQMSVSCCVTCAELISKGSEPSPQSKPLEYALCQQIADVIAHDPIFSVLGWLALRKSRGFSVPSLAEVKAFRALTDIRKKFILPETIEGGEGNTSALVKAAG